MIRVLCVCTMSLVLGCASVPPVESPEPDAAKPVVESSIYASEVEPTPEPDLTGSITWLVVRDLVLSRHAGLRAQSLSLSMADARLSQVELWPNPELGVEMENFGGTSPRNEFRGTETTVTMTQPVPLPGKRGLQRRVAGLDRRLAGWQVSQAKRTILLEAAQAYWTVLGKQSQVDLAQKQLAASRDLLAVVDKRVQAGKDSPVEMNKARIAVADQQIRVSQVESQLKLARVRLAAMWAGPDVFVQVQGDLADIPILPEEAELLDGLQTHPALNRWTDAILKAQAQKELARKEGYDDWAVTGGIKRLQEEHETTGVIGLAIPLPVFSRNQGRRREAVYRLAQVRALKQDAIQRLDAALQTQSIQARTTHADVVILRDNILPQAKMAYERSLTGYKQGRFDYLHVLDAQRMWFDQSLRYVETLLTYGVARAQVVSLAGLDYGFETKQSEGAQYE
jgi:cobalt-zinc-cadmium efflux system outer membrane protein